MSESHSESPLSREERIAAARKKFEEARKKIHRTGPSNNDHLAATNERIEALQKTIAEQNSELETLRSENSELKNTNQDLTARIRDLESTIETLKNGKPDLAESAASKLDDLLDDDLLDDDLIIDVHDQQQAGGHSIVHSRPQSSRSAILRTFSSQSEADQKDLEDFDKQIDAGLSDIVSSIVGHVSEFQPEAASSSYTPAPEESIAEPPASFQTNPEVEEMEREEKKGEEDQNQAVTSNIDSALETEAHEIEKDQLDNFADKVEESVAEEPAADDTQPKLDLDDLDLGPLEELDDDMHMEHQLDSEPVAKHEKEVDEKDDHELHDLNNDIEEGQTGQYSASLETEVHASNEEKAVDETKTLEREQKEQESHQEDEDVEKPADFELKPLDDDDVNEDIEEAGEDQEKLEQEKLDQETLEQERMEEERSEQERIEAEKREEERLEQERLEQERLENEKLENQRLEAERIEKERAEQDRLEQERIEQERAEQVILEQEKLAQEKAEQERVEQERLEKEKIEQEKAEQERLDLERAEKEKLEQERLEQERLEQERLEQERLEQERLEQERLEQERLEKERLEQERIEREQAEEKRVEEEKLESERLEQEKSEAQLNEEKTSKELNLEDESFLREPAEEEQKQADDFVDKSGLEKELLESELLDTSNPAEGADATSSNLDEAVNSKAEMVELDLNEIPEKTHQDLDLNDHHVQDIHKSETADVLQESSEGQNVEIKKESSAVENGETNAAQKEARPYKDIADKFDKIDLGPLQDEIVANDEPQAPQRPEEPSTAKAGAAIQDDDPFSILNDELLSGTKPTHTSALLTDFPNEYATEEQKALAMFSSGSTDFKESLQIWKNWQVDMTGWMSQGIPPKVAL